jgi:hypothetical protein
MKLESVLLDESTMDIEDLEVERDLQLAAVDAIRRARRFGTLYVIRHDKMIPPDQTGPYEERLLATADRLNRRIAELRGPAQNMELNDHPTEKQ